MTFTSHVFIVYAYLLKGFRVYKDAKRETISLKIFVPRYLIHKKVTLIWSWS